MVDSVRYLVSSVLDPSTGAASSATAGLPYTNTKDPLIKKVYRTTQKNSAWVRLRASGGATSINCVFIFNHTFTKNASVLWQGNSTSNFASGPALSTALSVVTDAQGNVVPKIGYFYSALQRHPHWRLYLKDTGNASSTLDVGRIMAGRYVEPARNIRDGFSLRTVDPSRGRRTAGRQGYFNLRRHYTEISYGITDMGEAQTDELLGIFAEVGTNQAFAFALDPDTRPTHNSFYCEFITPLDRQQRILKQFSLSRVTLQEKT